MKTSIHGRMAVAALCALLVACGGDGGGPPAPTVLPASVAIANDARVEAGTPERFATDVAVTEGLTFRWDFGDGSTGAGATATHAYAKAGQYQVTLAVANSAEDLRTATSTIQVGTYSNVTGLACTQADSAGWCWQHAIATGQQINDIFFVDATHAWAVGDGLTILKSVDGGNTWTSVAVDATLAPASLRSVRFYDATHGMALNDQGGALQTSDGGATWTRVPFGGLLYNGAGTFVAYGASRIIVATAYSNGAVMSVDGGATWTPVSGSGSMQATATDCWSFASYGVTQAPGCGPTSTYALAVGSLPNAYQSLLAGTFVSPTQGLALGYGYSYGTYTWTAQVWSTSDGGATWSNFVGNGLPTYGGYGQSLHMSDALVATAYNTSDLAAWTTQDGGHNWTAVVSSTAVAQVSNVYRATGFVGETLWQAAGNHVAISVDHAQTWHDAIVHDEDVATQYGQSDVATLAQYTDANDWVVAISHRFYVTHDAGQTFQRVLGPDVGDAGAASAAGFFLDAKNGRFLTSNGAMLSTADGGRTWARSDYPRTNNCCSPVALHFTSATQGWLVLAGELAQSTDGGATWSRPLTDSAITGLQGMSWGDATHAWAWNYNSLYATVDGGAHWNAVALPVNSSVTSAVMTGALSGVVASGYGGYLTTQDGGATWQTTPASITYGTLVHTSGQTVWSLSSATTRSKDGGRTWQAVGPVNYNTSVIGISFADDSHGWMITSAGAVLRTIDGGDTWSAQPVGTGLALEAIVAVDPMTAWIITRDGQVLATATAGD